MERLGELLRNERVTLVDVRAPPLFQRRVALVEGRVGLPQVRFAEVEMLGVELAWRARRALRAAS